MRGHYSKYSTMDIALLILITLVILFLFYKFLLVIVDIIIYLLVFPFILTARILKYFALIIWSKRKFFKSNTDYKIIEFNDYSIVRINSIGYECFREYVNFLIKYYFWLNLWRLNPSEKLLDEYIAKGYKTSSIRPSCLRKVHILYKDYNNRLEEIDKNILGAAFVNLTSLFDFKNKYEKGLDCEIFESLTIDTFNSDLKKRINEETNVVVKTDNQILQINSTYAIIFKSKETFINLFLNPAMGYIGNYSENKYHLYLSIGAMHNNLLNQCDSTFNSYEIVHKLKFTDLEINIGYDQISYIIYFFGSRYNISDGDSLIFKGDDEENNLQLDMENIYFEGDYKFKLDKKNLNLQINEYLSILREKNKFRFSIVRITTKKMMEISNFKDLKIYLYKSSYDNYYRLKGENSWCDKLSNEKLLQYLIKALPSIPEFENNEEVEYENKYNSDLKFDDIEPVYVYLMKDNHTEFYKIGISKDPKYREKTLLSQKPSIELIYKREFVDRELSLVMEKTLHNYFNHKRVRGEWFDLDKMDLVKFKSVLGID